MSALLEDIKTELINTTCLTKKEICVTCGNSSIERHVSGMINMICQISREGVNSFSSCCCYTNLEGGAE